MKYLLNNLKHFIDIDSLDLSRISDDITNIGFETESYTKEINAKDLLVGFVESVTKHENSDKLNICKIKTKLGNNVIVTGAKNIIENRYVVVVPVGKKVGDLEIVERDLRGVMSYGMICSLEEIGFNSNYVSDYDSQGIKLLNGKPNIKDDVNEILGLSSGILELDILPNRNDVASYEGLARELSWKYNLKFKKLKFNTKNDLNFEKDVNFLKGLSSSLLVADIKNVDNISNNIVTSLIVDKIKSNSNIEDASNFFGIFTGLPILSIDFDLVSDIKYKVNKKETVANFDGKEFKVPLNVPIIVSDKKIVGIPGIVVFDEFRPNRDTKRVIFESSFIGNDYSSKLEASYKNITKNVLRQNREFNKSLVNENLNKFVNYFRNMNVISKSSEIETNISDVEFKPISIDEKYLLKATGTNIKLPVFSSTLKKLGYEIVNNEWPLTVIPPKHRIDVFGRADLLEDFIRVKGLDFLNNDLSFKMNDYKEVNEMFNFNNKISNELIFSGLSNILTGELINEKDSNSTNLLFKKDKVFSLDGS